MRLLIPFASSSAPECADMLAKLQLPFLEKLLRRLTLVESDAAPADSLSPPHERALARLEGIAAPDGCIAWAALEARRTGRPSASQAWAWITPVHWDVGADHIRMADPQTLDLRDEESAALFTAMQPFFAEDGIALERSTPQRWLAGGEVFDHLASAALDRVAGREISGWMPAVPQLRRLQNEMQMLLYTHPVNEARMARGLAAVNSFWISGTGRLAAPPQSLHGDRKTIVAYALRDAALRNDWPAWARAWVQIDQTECRNLLQSLDANAELSLCGERSAMRFTAVRAGILDQLRMRFKPTTLQGLQEQL